MNTLIKGLENATNVAYTDNGAKSNASSKSALLDLFSQGGSQRNNSEAQIIKLFSKAYGTNKLLALKTLFYLRDIRGGQGERRTFRVIFKWLAENDRQVALANLHLLPLYGRWDDWVCVAGTDLEKDAIQLLSDQLREDSAEKDSTKLSLAGKWAPSINTSSAVTRQLAGKVALHMGISHGQYRKMLSKLRSRLNVVEKLLCAKDWDSIDYSKVPSRASLVLRKAFDRHDHARFLAWKEAVSRGDKGVKVNASTLYPYDIVSNVRKGNADPLALDNQWKALPDFIGENKGNHGIVVCDTSASMTWTQSGNVQPIDVALSLSIYFAERNTGQFKDHFITFSSAPELQKIRGHNISEKVRNLSNAYWSGNTNIQAVFDLVLDTARRNSVSQDELPEAIYIISDMQFDIATSSNSMSNFEAIDRKFKAAGYERPRLVFWNVNAFNTDSPVTVDDKGVVMVSGCSPSILKTVLANKQMDAYDIFLSAVTDERYRFVSLG